MASTSEIKNGVCLEVNHDIWQVVEFLHVKPGKGAAFVRTKLKSLKTGKVVDKTIPAGHKIDIVRIERRTFQYLYKDDMGYNFMNNETFEQVALDEKLLENADLMLEGMNVDVLYHSEKDLPLTCEMAQFVTMEVTYTEPGLKGDTATNASKPATVESGATLNVPLFINQGDRIKIDTKSRSYVGREK